LTHGAEKHAANLPWPKVEVPVEGTGGTELPDEGKILGREEEDEHV